MDALFITTSEESPWIPDLLQCIPDRVLEGPNRSDYLLVNVTNYRAVHSSELVIATRHLGDSLQRLPQTGSIGIYIIELKHRLAAAECSFDAEDVSKWRLGSAYGPEAARLAGFRGSTRGFSSDPS